MSTNINANVLRNFIVKTIGADKLTRNEIATSNEIRQIIGWKPSKDPSADELRNKNLNQTAEEANKVEQPYSNEEYWEENQNE